MELRCQDCGKVENLKKSDVDNSSCDCGGDFAIKDSEDDEYEPVTCPICKKEIQDAENHTWECEECREENVCEDCIIEFEDAGCFYCKNCVDKAYPRSSETKIEYQEKIVEKPIYVDKDGTPIDTTFNPNNKSKFD